MKSFTKQEIDHWRDVFVQREYPRENVEIDGRKIDYFIMPSEVFQGIPNGLFRMTGEVQDGYVVGVSEEVPEIIKPYFALSEHDEFMVYGFEDKDRTLHSEENILRVMGNSELSEVYVPNKVKLYDHIVTHAREDLEKWGFTEEDYRGFVRALDYLRSES